MRTMGTLAAAVVDAPPAVGTVVTNTGFPAVDASDPATIQTLWGTYISGFRTSQYNEMVQRIDSSQVRIHACYRMDAMHCVGLVVSKWQASMQMHAYGCRSRVVSMRANTFGYCVMQQSPEESVVLHSAIDQEDRGKHINNRSMCIWSISQPAHAW